MQARVSHAREPATISMTVSGIGRTFTAFFLTFTTLSALSGECRIQTSSV